MEPRRKPILMQVRDVESGRLATIRRDDIKDSKPWHDSLTSEQSAWADRLFGRIGRWFKATADDWRDGFRYDLHPEAELRVWDHIADVVDELSIAQPAELVTLNRGRLGRLVVAVSSRVIDIPSQMPDVTDPMVGLVKAAFSGGAGTGSDPVQSSSRVPPPSDLAARITVDPGMMFGKPCIRGLRYPVDFVLELLDSDMTREEILADYEDLESADLDAAIEYASDQGSTRRAQMAVA